MSVGQVTPAGAADQPRGHMGSASPAAGGTVRHAADEHGGDGGIETAASVMGEGAVEGPAGGLGVPEHVRACLPAGPSGVVTCTQRVCR